MDLSLDAGVVNGCSNTFVLVMGGPAPQAG
jgi:hypothetical protein